jgi:hypothetical protein
MKYAIMLAYIPHDDHGFWLWSIHDKDMQVIAYQQPGIKGYKNATAALMAAQAEANQLFGY